MDESHGSNLGRDGAAAGIAFVVLLVVSAFMVPAPPHIDASATKIAKYYFDHHNRVLGSQMLAAFGVAVLVWFVAHLRHVLHRAEAGTEGLAAFVFGSGLVLAAVAAASLAPLAILAYAGRQKSEVIVNAAMVRGLFDMNLMFGNLLGILSGLFVAATAYAMIRRELAAPWLGWVGLLVALASWVAGGAGFFVTKNNGGFNALGLLSFLGFLAFVLATSISMLVGQPDTARASTVAPSSAG